MLSFYVVMFVENGMFVGAYYWFAHARPGLPLTWFSVGAMLIVLGGTVVGTLAMILYYRYNFTIITENTHRGFL